MAVLIMRGNLLEIWTETLPKYQVQRDLQWRTQLFCTSCVYSGEPTSVFAKNYELGTQICEEELDTDGNDIFSSS